MAQDRRKSQSGRGRAGLPRVRAKGLKDMATEIREEGKMRTGQASGACRERSSASDFLSGLSGPAARAFESIRVTTTYPAGAVLFAEGEEPNGVFVLSAGRAKLSICSSNGKMMILRIARPGEILGLHGVVSSACYQATAQTIEPCRVNFVRRHEFLRFLRAHPQASLEAARQLSSSYQEACVQLRALGLCDSARKRVARFVLDWAESGEMGQEGVRATLALTHEEIGQLIGTSRETITRALGEFRSKKWIAIKGTSLLVKNIEALQEMVGDDVHSSWASAASQAEMARSAPSYTDRPQPGQAGEICR
jgi:CRP/FNR family cyclic AMP-dependent transcriptional regulator